MFSNHQRWSIPNFHDIWGALGAICSHLAWMGPQKKQVEIFISERLLTLQTPRLL